MPRSVARDSAAINSASLTPERVEELGDMVDGYCTTSSTSLPLRSIPEAERVGGQVRGSAGEDRGDLYPSMLAVLTVFLVNLAW